MFKLQESETMPKLTVILAAMNQGKSTHLLQSEWNYRELGYKSLIIKPCTDTRDGAQNGWGTIKSRLIDEGTPCLYVQSLNKEKLFNLIRKNEYKVVFIDEIQFFNRSDALIISDVVDELGISCFCYGLKVDSNGMMFEGIKHFLALSDDIKEWKHICKCGDQATMHLRLINNVPVLGNSVAIEGEDKVEYKSVCRKCWKKALKEAGLTIC